MFVLIRMQESILLQTHLYAVALCCPPGPPVTRADMQVFGHPAGANLRVTSSPMVIQNQTPYPVGALAHTYSSGAPYNQGLVVPYSEAR